MSKKNEEKTAREIFEELGWMYVNDEGNICYDRYDIDTKERKYISISSIYFDLEKKQYVTWMIKSGISELLYLEITPELHNAIDKQMKELELVEWKKEL